MLQLLCDRLPIGRHKKTLLPDPERAVALDSRPLVTLYQPSTCSPATDSPDTDTPGLCRAPPVDNYPQQPSIGLFPTSPRLQQASSDRQQHELHPATNCKSSHPARQHQPDPQAPPPAYNGSTSNPVSPSYQPCRPSLTVRPATTAPAAAIASTRCHPY